MRRRPASFDDMAMPDPGPPSSTAGAGFGLFVAVTLAALLALGVAGAVRGVNADEGFYVAAGEQVGRGARPYADFFYPQMPYLPLLEAAVFSVTGTSLVAARMLSVVPGALLAGLLAVAAARRAGGIGIGVAVAIAYVTHVLVLNYVTVVKTYGMSNLFLVCALLLVGGDDSSPRRCLAAGVCAALAVGIRLPAVAVLSVLFVWCWFGSSRQALAFAAGAAVAGLPALILAANDPQAFWFDNVGFHNLRREIVGFGPIVAQKLRVLMRWLFVPQNLMVWAMAGAGLYLGSRREVLAAACAAAIGALYLYATPTYLEYMVQLLPFLLLAAIPAIGALLSRRRLAAVIAVLWVFGLGLALRPATAGTVRAAKTELWSLTTVDAVVSYLREHSEPDEPVLSWWEGYPVLAGRPGFKEVGFWQSNAGKKMSPELRRRYHIAAEEDVKRIIEARTPRLIVFPQDVWPGLRDAIERGYRQAALFGVVQVYERRPGNA
jgi:hypothetical protein